MFSANFVMFLWKYAGASCVLTCTTIEVITGARYVWKLAKTSTMMRVMVIGCMVHIIELILLPMQRIAISRIHYAFLA